MQTRGVHKGGGVRMAAAAWRAYESRARGVRVNADVCMHAAFGACAAGGSGS